MKAGLLFAVLSASVWAILVTDPRWWVAGLEVAAVGAALVGVALVWSWRWPLNRWDSNTYQVESGAVYTQLVSRRYQQVDRMECAIAGPVSETYVEEDEGSYAATPHSEYQFGLAQRPPDGAYTVRWTVSEGKARFVYPDSFVVEGGIMLKGGTSR